MLGYVRLGPLALPVFLAAKRAALEATFKLVNQSKSVMSCNFRHSDILFVCSSQDGDHYDGI